MTGELETRTRTMQIEINIDNTEGFLVAGSFAYVTLHIPIQSYPQIPVSGSWCAVRRHWWRCSKTTTLRQADSGRLDRRQHRLGGGGLRQGDRIAINLPDE